MTIKEFLPPICWTKFLCYPADQNNQPMGSITTSCLKKTIDKTTHMLYEQSLDDPKELQTVTHFLAFLKGQFQMMEQFGMRERPKATIFATTTFNQLCKLCNKGSHSLSNCHRFLSASKEEKENFIKRFDLCWSCLKHGHSASKCFKKQCDKCD